MPKVMRPNANKTALAAFRTNSSRESPSVRAAYAMTTSTRLLERVFIVPQVDLEPPTASK
jgi:hypothetical protein